VLDRVDGSLDVSPLLAWAKSIGVGAGTPREGAITAPERSIR
jgi:hypothetical protein